jgi:UPF0271 protein
VAEITNCVVRIDINADVGETAGGRPVGDDAALMPHITSANIACGFHAGDPSVMRATVALAAEHGVAVGAHPGFPDLEHFGRRELQVAPRDVEDFVAYQVGALAAIAAAQGVRLQHVKPHGALFNMACRDAELADAVARAVRTIDPTVMLFGLPESELIRAGWRLHLRTAREGFADRAYREDGSLVPRSEPDAVIHEPSQVARRAVEMARSGRVDTICVHGDTAGAPELAARIRRALADAHIEVSAVSKH